MQRGKESLRLYWGSFRCCLLCTSFPCSGSTAGCVNAWSMSQNVCERGFLLGWALQSCSLLSACHNNSNPAKRAGSTGGESNVFHFCSWSQHSCCSKIGQNWEQSSATDTSHTHSSSGHQQSKSGFQVLPATLLGENIFQLTHIKYPVLIQAAALRH